MIGGYRCESSQSKSESKLCQLWIHLGSNLTSTWRRSCGLFESTQGLSVFDFERSPWLLGAWLPSMAAVSRLFYNSILLKCRSKTVFLKSGQVPTSETCLKFQPAKLISSSEIFLNGAKSLIISVLLCRWKLIFWGFHLKTQKMKIKKQTAPCWMHFIMLFSEYSMIWYAYSIFLCAHNSIPKCSVKDQLLHLRVLNLENRCLGMSLERQGTTGCGKSKQLKPKRIEWILSTHAWGTSPQRSPAKDPSSCWRPAMKAIAPSSSGSNRVP